MGWIPAVSIYSTTKEYYHSPTDPRFALIPVIHRAAIWWIPVRTWAYNLSPPISSCHIILLTAPPPCTSIPGPVPFPQSFVAPSLPCPNTSELSAGLVRLPKNLCYCRQLFTLGMETPPSVVGHPHCSGAIPYFPWSSVVRSRVLDAFCLPAYISLTRSGRCLASPLGLGYCSGRNWGRGWGAPPGYWSYPPSAAFWIVRENHYTYGRTPGSRGRGRGIT